MDSKAKSLILLLAAFLLLAEANVFIHEGVHRQINYYFGLPEGTTDIGLFKGSVHIETNPGTYSPEMWLAHSINEIAGYVILMGLLIWTASRLLRILE